MSEIIIIDHRPILINTQTHIDDLHCKDCGQFLDALHMSDVDKEYCGECTDKRVEKLQKDLPETTLVLWERMCP